MKTIFLTGFMGAGKTTIGRILAEKLGCEVTDTDEVIEQRQGIPITQIFAEKGEGYFRELETQALKAIGQNAGIITTGGGIIEREENRKLMKEKGIVLFLEADFSVLWERLKEDNARPLIQEKNKQVTEGLYERRLPLYHGTADEIILTADQEAKETVDEIIARLKLAAGGNAEIVK